MLASDLSHPHSSESSERLVFRSDCDVILLYLLDSSCLFLFFVRAYYNLFVWKKMNCVRMYSFLSAEQRTLSRVGLPATTTRCITISDIQSRSAQTLLTDSLGNLDVHTFRSS